MLQRETTITTTSQRTPRRPRGRNVSRQERRDVPIVDFTTLSSERLDAMAEAGREVLECHRALAKGGSNIVAEVLPREGTFYELAHCPAGDIYDQDSYAQYYYHSHRRGEHGHFHTFLREAGMPRGVCPVEQSETDAMKQRGDKLSHLVAISMDPRGIPIALFTTNRWVTAENWYSAASVAAMLDRFAIDHAQPSWATNRWVTAMLQLFRPQIVALLYQRDAGVEKWQKQHPNEDVLEDRSLDLPSWLDISVDDQIHAVQATLNASG